MSTSVIALIMDYVCLSLMPGLNSLITVDYSKNAREGTHHPEWKRATAPRYSKKTVWLFDFLASAGSQS